MRVRELHRMENLDDQLRIRKATEYLGVSPNAIRLWDQSEKINDHCHPVNNSRLSGRNCYFGTVNSDDRTRTSNPGGH